jgi:hypothetical protein
MSRHYDRLEETLDSGDESVGEKKFDEREMDKTIRQIIDKVRGSYLQNGETGRGIPSEVKRIIEQNIDRI